MLMIYVGISLLGSLSGFCKTNDVRLEVGRDVKSLLGSLSGFCEIKDVKLDDRQDDIHLLCPLTRFGTILMLGLKSSEMSGACLGAVLIL